MPTTLPRTLITHTSDIQHALEIAERRWPGDRPGALLHHLIEAGARTVAAEDEEANVRYRAMVEEIANSFGDLYPPGYLEELREGWPE